MNVKHKLFVAIVALGGVIIGVTIFTIAHLALGWWGVVIVAALAGWVSSRVKFYE